MQDKTILVIDDDINLCQMIKYAFMREGATVFAAANGEEGLRQFIAHRPDLVLLDIRMPVMDGWETCQTIRRLSTVPIIMLTTLHHDEEEIRGLEYGADDFVSKPFSSGVLLARVCAVLRRAELPVETREAVYYSDDYLTIDVSERRILVEGKPVKLSAREFDVLAYLVKNAGRIVTYQQILDRIWGWEYRDNVDYLHVYLSHLRRKLEKDPKNPIYLLTEYEVGYRFEKLVTSP